MTRGLATLSFDEGGSGDRLVLAHGFTQTRKSWGQIAIQLEKNFHVVAVDLPGHGRSGDIRANIADGAQMLAEVGGKATYLGYSMGGRYCVELAVQHPELIDRLILVSTSPGIRNNAEREQRRLADEALADQLDEIGIDDFLSQWISNPLFAGITDEQVNLPARRENRAENLASSLRMAGVGSQEPRWNQLAQLDMPVLIMAGENDDRYRMQCALMAGAIGDNAEFVVIPGSTHAAHLQQPEFFVETIESFLAKHLQPNP